MNSTVGRAVECIWERYGEPLTIADLASSAILSKYHFCRTFVRATGVSPGRFLSAVRIYQAKRLLSSTAFNVTDISFAVGFNSLGSFTNHFTESVGISPGRFRRMAQGDGFDFLRPSPSPLSPGGAVGCTITPPKGHAIASVYVGVFQTTILQGWPQEAMVLQVKSPGQWPVSDLRVPPGEWFAHAVAVADTIDPEPWNRRVLLVAKSGPVVVRDGASTRALLSLRPASKTDPPILFALPELDAMLNQANVQRRHYRQLDASVTTQAESVAGSARAC
jgi:AraC family transcriptional regulator